jgi:hypothetical protein
MLLPRGDGDGDGDGSSTGTVNGYSEIISPNIRKDIVHA